MALHVLASMGMDEEKTKRRFERREEERKYPSRSLVTATVSTLF